VIRRDLEKALLGAIILAGALTGLLAAMARLL
jgi:hypothetical protein